MLAETCEKVHTLKKETFFLTTCNTRNHNLKHKKHADKTERYAYTYLVFQ